MKNQHLFTVLGALIVAALLTGKFGFHSSNVSTDAQLIETSEEFHMPKAEINLQNANSARLPHSENELEMAMPKAVPAWGEMKKEVQKPLEKKADAKKALADAKKQDKKKKKVAKKKKDDKKPETKVAQKESAKDDSTTPSGFSGGSAPAPQAYGVTQTQNLEPQTLEEWMDYVLNSKDFNHVNLMVKRMQDGKIQASWFYAITQKMIETDSPKLKELALFALASFNRTESYSQLAQLYYTEASNNLGAKVYNALHVYTQFQYTNILTAALDSEMDEVKIITAQMIQRSAEFNLDPSHNRGRGIAVSSTSQAQVYKLMMTKLANLSKDSNTQVRNACYTAFRLLEQLLQVTA